MDLTLNSERVMVRKEFDQRLRLAHPSERKRIIRHFLMGPMKLTLLQKAVDFLVQLYALCMAEHILFEDIGNFTFNLMTSEEVGPGRRSPLKIARQLWTDYPHIFDALKKSFHSFMRSVRPTHATLIANPQIIVNALWQFERDPALQEVDEVRKAVYMRATKDFFIKTDARIVRYIPPSMKCEVMKIWCKSLAVVPTIDFYIYENCFLPTFFMQMKEWKEDRLTSTLVIGGLFHQVYKTAAPAYYEIVDDKRRLVSTLEEKNKSFFDQPMIAAYLPVFKTLAMYIGFHLENCLAGDVVVTKAVFAVPRPKNKRPAGYFKTALTLP